MSKPKIKVDIVSDVVCPWCYIGKRRLERAIDSLKDRFEFDLKYHPFELNPEIPSGGVDQKSHFTKKFGGEDRYQKITNHVTQVASGEGLHFDFEKQNVTPNTRQAHSIIQLALPEGKQPAVKEAFMKAYFVDGIDLSKKENLLQIAETAGLSKSTVEKLLANDEGLKEVAKAEHELQKLGITGVPFYIINNKYGISGAQPTESFIEAFENIASEVNVENP